ncbi:MAG: hypothetical protein FWC41_00500 [Firmicutes bacterium]|nr:hypothetical protein [Bacillota bacterium]
MDKDLQIAPEIAEAIEELNAKETVDFVDENTIMNLSNNKDEDDCIYKGCDCKDDKNEPD